MNLLQQLKHGRFVGVLSLKSKGNKHIQSKLTSYAYNMSMGGHLTGTVSLQTAFTQAQQDYFMDYPEVDPSEVCISVGSVSAQLEGMDPSYLQMTDIQQQLLSGFSDMQSYGEIGVVLTNHALQVDSLFCSTPDDSFDGWYQTEEDIVFVDPDQFEMANLPAVLLEEFGHQEQYSRTDFEAQFYDGIEDLSLKDRLSVALSAEAQIKLSIAYQAVSNVWNEGDSTLYDNLDPDRVVRAMADTLMTAVNEQGVAALEDPDVMFDAYSTFFQHDVVDVYTQIYLQGVLGYENSSQRLDPALYNSTFGTLIGADTDINFLEGNIGHMDDLDPIVHAGQMSDASRFYQYFDIVEGRAEVPSNDTPSSQPDSVPSLAQ